MKKSTFLLSLAFFLLTGTVLMWLEQAPALADTSQVEETTVTIASATPIPRPEMKFESVARVTYETVSPTPEPTPKSEPIARYTLTDAERDLIERVLMQEAGSEPYTGQIAVAQCILTACEMNGIRPEEVIRKYKYSKKRPEPSASVKEAVAAVFDNGETVTDEPIKYFYAPGLCDSRWHETQIFVIEIGGHRFFAERQG